MGTDKDMKYDVEHKVTPQEDPEQQSPGAGPAFTDVARDPENQTQVKGGGAYGGVRTEHRDERPVTEEERRRAMPVAAVPASVNLDDVEPVDGFRLPETQPEAEDARLAAERERQDLTRPEVARQLADEALAHAEKARGHAELARERADQIAEAYDGPDRPMLDEGWRYKKPEPDVHDPV